MAYQFAQRIMTLEASPLRENAKKNMESAAAISFAYGFPPTEAFPMATLKEISQKLYNEADPESFLQYGASEGYPRLRTLIKERLRQLSNIDNEEEVLVVSGSTQAMDLAVKVFCNEGDVVLCEEQTFSGAVNAIKGYGAIPVPVPMDLAAESMDLDALETILKTDARVKMLYLIPTFQNPLGTSMPLEKRKAIYALACQYDVLIFEDDPYGELLYEGTPIPKMKTLDTEGRIIYAGSFSKILAPSSRIGFMMTAGPAMEKLILAKQSADSHTNFYWQVVLADYMDHHDFEGHVAQLTLLYQEKYARMLQALQALPTDKLTFIKPTGGYFITCFLSTEVDAERFYDYLDEAKVAVIPGNIMSVAGKGYEHSFRLNFTKPTLAQIDQGIALLGDALDYAMPPAYEGVI